MNVVYSVGFGYAYLNKSISITTITSASKTIVDKYSGSSTLIEPLVMLEFPSS